MKKYVLKTPVSPEKKRKFLHPSCLQFFFKIKIGYLNPALKRLSSYV